MSDDFLEYTQKMIEKVSKQFDIPKPKIEPPKTTLARLVIGYDKSKDVSYLVVGAQYFGSDETWILNDFRNEHADFVYDLLTNPRSIEKIKWENKNDKIETDKH